MKSNKGALLECVICCIKRQKSSHDNNETKSAFQTIAIEFSKQPK